MEIESVDKWFMNLKNAWLQKDIDLVLDLFSQQCIYYEHPLESPGIGHEEIRNFWQEIKSQRIADLTINTVAVTGNTAVAHWYLKLQHTEEAQNSIFDGIYVVEFDSDGKCSKFTQWWVEPEV